MLFLVFYKPYRFASVLPMPIIFPTASLDQEVRFEGEASMVSQRWPSTQIYTRHIYSRPEDFYISLGGHVLGDKIPTAYA